MTKQLQFKTVVKTADIGKLATADANCNCYRLSTLFRARSRVCAGDIYSIRFSRCLFTRRETVNGDNPRASLVLWRRLNGDLIPRRLVSRRSISGFITSGPSLRPTRFPDIVVDFLHKSDAHQRDRVEFNFCCQEFL